ncbi:MAG: hypothetical protein PHS74_04330 [Lachnospiraceae bacterium]|nr:hypothetical protein [Lachnospiraceae bacterium]
MRLNSTDASYRRYKQYRVNRHRFKTEQVTFPIAMLVLIGIITKFWYLIIVLTSIFIVLYIANFFNISKKDIKNISEEEGESMGSINNKESVELKNFKSTDSGYVNKNSQRNNGRSSKPGTDSNQWFYNMNCLHCGHTYYANGTDIWQRKCPNCQGGKE